jgi:spore germination protein YaaH
MTTHCRRLLVSAVAALAAAGAAAAGAPVPEAAPAAAGAAVPATSPPTAGKTGKLLVGGWLPTTWDYENSFSSFSANAGLMAQVSPVWFWATDGGGIAARRPGGTAGADPGPCEEEVRAVCRSRGIKLIPLISNSGPGRGFDAAMVGRIVNSRERTAAHVKALTKLAVDRGYDGIEIDYELLKPGDRDAFSRFMAALGASLHARGKLLAIAVHAKMAEPGDDWGPRTHDYRALGRVVDIFRVMTYDLHWMSGPPGPLAPLPWFKEVLAFTVSQVPRQKVQMGIPTYGYDWPRGGKGATRDVTAREVPLFAASLGLVTEWDGASSSPFVRYSGSDGEREVWYEDARCLEAKLAVVREAGIMGIAIWRLGSEQREFWEVLGRPEPGK